MKTVKLLVPFSLPLLGEAFIDIGNPVLISTINFFTEVEIKWTEASKASTPISSPRLKRIFEDFLNSRGEHKSYHITPQDPDYLLLTSLLYLVGVDSVEVHAPRLINKLNGPALMTMVRALAALSGGFVVCRKGEGLLSLNGCPEASVILNIKYQNKSVTNLLKKFSATYPDLSHPLWHTVGHLVIEGSKAIRENDPKRLGSLMTIESSISCAIGIISPRDLTRLFRIKNIYGAKAINSGDLKGDLILSPKETSRWGDYQKFCFTYNGVSEID
ncbi:MAG: hypothetical protein ACUVQ5_00910 [Candidatus Methanomethylicaceae archaeon]